MRVVIFFRSFVRSLFTFIFTLLFTLLQFHSTIPLFVIFTGSPLMGDIQLSLYDRRGALEVEIIRAKGLLMKPGAKTLPGTF